MSREQGPRAVGMRPSANAAWSRPGWAGIGTMVEEASSMSREQGPRAVGMLIADET